MSDEQKRILERQLWSVANVLRGKMHADEYKNYILGFIFYKYLSEKLELYTNKNLLAREDFKFAEIKEDTKDGKEYLKHTKKACLDHLGFFLTPTELFSYIVKKGKGEIKGQNNFILEDLKKILNKIEQTSVGTASEDDFKGLFDDVDLTSTKLGSKESNKNDVIIEVLSLLNGIDFQLEDAKSDLLGDAYEYLVGEFASGAGKKGGEFYTPPQVSRLISKIVTIDKKRIKSAYDPTCGSGSLLLRLREFTDVSSYYGQELNPTTHNLARMNMILHGVHFDHFNIKRGDTLTEDMFPDLKAEIIVANPPFAVNWKGESDPQLAQDDRFSQYGRLAPKSVADYAFATHMIHHLADNGTMATVLPHGALFRSGAEGHIRKYIVEKQNYLDAVIGLPANLFYGTSISATILIFKKCRKDDEDILFIDASKDFEKVGNQNKLTDENIEKIYDTYKNRREIAKYSHKANIKEIRENGYNLNISRYVDAFEDEIAVDIKEVSKKLKKLNIEEIKLQDKIIAFCEELNIPKLEGNNLPLLKEYKKGVMQKIFSQEIRFKDNQGKNFPKWEVKKLGEIVKFLRGASVSKSDVRENGKYPYIMYGELFVNYKEIIENIKSKTDKDVEPKSKTGDILMPSSDVTPTGLATASAIFKDGVVLGGDINILRPISNDLDSHFLSYLINFNKKSILRLVTGTTIKHIYISEIKNIVYKMPSFDEQQKIGEFLTYIDKVIELKNNQIVQAEQ